MLRHASSSHSISLKPVPSSVPDLRPQLFAALGIAQADFVLSCLWSSRLRNTHTRHLLELHKSLKPPDAALQALNLQVRCVTGQPDWLVAKAFTALMQQGATGLTSPV